MGKMPRIAMTPPTATPKEGDFYDSDYFISGVQSGKSNYESYSWRPDLTLPMVACLQRHMDIRGEQTVLDFGCARGFVVKALRMVGIDARGYDHATWPIENCDPAVVPYVSSKFDLPELSVDHVFSKDVFEHMSLRQIEEVFPKLCAATRRSLLVIVPLAYHQGGKYLRNEDESDPSHVVRFTLDNWLSYLSLLCPGFAAYGSYHLKGLKPASVQVPYSCGFLYFKRF